MGDGDCFTVEEAAKIMLCHQATIYRLIEDGWLNKPSGGSRKERCGRVTQKSLFQFMVIDRLSRVPLRTLKQLKNGRKHFGRIFSQTPNANRYYIKGTHEADRALSSVEPPAPEIPDTGLRAPSTEQQHRCLHHDFVEQNQKIFRRRARQLAAGDPAFQEDLVQVMSLAVLQYEKQADFEFLLELAGNRAMDYIRYEASRGMLPLDAAQHMSDKAAERKASLIAFIEELEQRGVPRKWIEEVIDWRLAVA